MNRRSARPEQPGHDDERGAALLLAIGVMIMVGLITAGILSFVTTSVRGRASLDAIRSRQYAADAAVETDVARVRALNTGAGTAVCSTTLSGVTRYTNYAAVNGVRIRVECANRPTFVWNPTTLELYQLRNVSFIACLQSAAIPCPVAQTIVSAQVSYEFNPPSAVTATRAFVQSWSVNQ